MFLKIKLDKSHNAVGHAAQLCRNDEYHVTAKAPHVFSVTVVVIRLFDFLYICTLFFQSILFTYSTIYLAVQLFVGLINSLNVRIKDVSLWITRIAIIYSKATSSRFITPSHFPLVHSKGTRAECLHARIFLISTDSDNPGLWALFVSLSLSYIPSPTSLTILSSFPEQCERSSIHYLHFHLRLC